MNKLQSFAIRFCITCQILLLIALLCLSPLAHAEQFGHMRFTLPPDWKSQQNDQILFLSPANLPSGQSAMVAIWPSLALRDFQAQFDTVVKKLQSGNTVVKIGDLTRARSPDGYDVLRREMIVQDKNGRMLYFFVTAAYANQRFESLYYFTNNADLYKQHAPRVESLVNSIKFTTSTQTPNTQPTAAQNTPPQNNTAQLNYVDAKAKAKGEANLNPPPPGNARLDGLFATQDSGGQIGPGGVLYSNVTWRFYYFMPNGYVYLGAKNAGLENLSCTRATVDKYGEAQCTTYAADGDQIRMGNRNATRLRRKGNDLMIGDYTYERIPKASNLNINGSYGSYAAGVAAATSSDITFSRNGRFKSSSFTGVSYDTGSMPGGAQQPNRVGVTGTSSTGGEGTYRINGYTLDLTYSDGRKSRAFFAQVAGDSVVQIGSRIYTRSGK